MGNKERWEQALRCSKEEKGCYDYVRSSGSGDGDKRTGRRGDFCFQGGCGIRGAQECRGVGDVDRGQVCVCVCVFGGVHASVCVLALILV